MSAETIRKRVEAVRVKAAAQGRPSQLYADVTLLMAVVDAAKPNHGVVYASESDQTWGNNPRCKCGDWPCAEQVALNNLETSP